MADPVLAVSRFESLHARNAKQAGLRKSWQTLTQPLKRIGSAIVLSICTGVEFRLAAPRFFTRTMSFTLEDICGDWWQFRSAMALGKPSFCRVEHRRMGVTCRKMKGLE